MKMKKTASFLRVIVFSAVIMFAMASCENPTSDSPITTVVNIDAIQGLTIPATGGTPVTSITENAQYSGTVTWSPNHSTFAASTVYTATITLTPKTGFTLTGVAANFFKVSGATATNSSNSGIINAVFPAAGAKAVASIAIKTQPTTLTYTHGNTLNLAGLVVTLTYNDATTEDVAFAQFAAKSLTANPAHGVSLVHVTHNGQPVTVTYGNLTPPMQASTSILTVAKAAGTWVSTSAVNTSYTPTLTLGDVTLPDGYAFTAPATKLNAGSQYFAATYTNPSGNYEPANGNITVSVAKAGPASWPTAAAITYPSPLSASVLSGGDTAAGSFAWTTGTTIPDVTNSGYSVTFTPVDTANYAVTTGTVAITVNKAVVTDALAAPGLNRTAHNRILISVTSSVGSGQRIEYGISATNNAADAVWQSALLFTGLNTSTTYYFFARIAERPNYSTGPASDSLQATTRSSNVLTVTSTAEWADARAHINALGGGTAETPQTYTISVSGNVSAGSGSYDNTFYSVSNVTVTLQGSGKLYLTDEGIMFRVGSNQTLIIDSADLTLQGLTSGQNGASKNNRYPLIYNSGTLELKNGEISGNTSSINVTYPSGYGGGVYTTGNFTMNGGTIKGNVSTLGGNSDASYFYYSGGGVYVDGTGSFSMNGGTISGNSSYSGYGGGVYVRGTGSSFTMNGGTISGNINSSYSNYGGGVYASTFTMTGGTISDNSSGHGGGVYADSAFTMTGGTISGNSGNYGGGVYAIYRFSKTGGIIYGNDASATDQNTTGDRNGSGHAVYFASSLTATAYYYRDSTLGESDNLSSSSPLPANSGQSLNGWTKK